MNECESANNPMAASSTPNESSLNVNHGNQSNTGGLMRLVEAHDHLYLSSTFYSNNVKHSHHDHNRNKIDNGNDFQKCSSTIKNKSSNTAMNIISSNTNHNSGKSALVEFSPTFTSPNDDEILKNDFQTNHLVRIEEEYENESSHLVAIGDVSNDNGGPNPRQFIIDKQARHSQSIRMNPNTISQASEEFDDEFIDEEDSNDTQSCSSSSGCSSSSNSMVGSVNRHLSLNNNRYQNQSMKPSGGIVTNCNTSSIASSSNVPNSKTQNGTTYSNGTSSSICQYKDLTPKQVKRKLDWDSTPEKPPVVAKTTMTAVNGKQVSVRTFKLSNAMKQSLVASGCSKAVAVAAVAAAFQAKSDNSNHEKLIPTHATYSRNPTNVVNGNVNGSAMQIVAGNHQPPTAIAIVNGPSSKSLTPTVATIVTTSTSLSNGTTNSTSQSQGIFKTPLAPKVAPSSIGSFSSISHQPQHQPHQLYIFNKNLNDEPINRVTPILANSVKTISKQQNKPVETQSNKPGRSKKPRANILRKNSNVEHPTTPKNNGRTSKSNRSRASQNNSFENKNPDSPSTYSSPHSSNDNSNDMFPSSSLYSSTSSSNNSYQPYSPSSCSSTEFVPDKSRKSGRTRSETSLGQLTRKFISLLEQSSDGSINLNEASFVLEVQKRRIYDITNVLEGVGLLHKTSKNNIQWRGGLVDYFSGRNPSDRSDQPSHYRNRKPPPLSLLFGASNKVNGQENDDYSYLNSSPHSFARHLSNLENDENRLDHLIKLAREDLNKIKTSCAPHLYASYNDFRRIPEFKDQTVIGIRPPMDTTLVVRDPTESLEIRIKNPRGEMIEVYLCQEQEENQITSQTPIKKEHEIIERNLRTHERIIDSPNNKRFTVSNDMMNTNLTCRILEGSNNSELSEIIPVEIEGSDMNNTESGFHSYFDSNSTPIAQNKINIPNKVVSNSNIKEKNQPDNTFSLNGDSMKVDKSLLSDSSVYEEQDNLHVKSEPSSQHDSYAHAFICHDDEFGPLGSRSYSTQTEDQITIKSSAGLIEANGGSSESGGSHQFHPTSSSHYHSPHSSSPFALIPLEPPVTVDEDYNFTLYDNEGIAELFDDNDFPLL